MQILLIGSTIQFDRKKMAMNDVQYYSEFCIQ